MAQHGFAKHDYFQGLCAAEFFYHTMAGGDGFIDASAKAASTACLPSRLLKAMGTIMALQDGSCRDSRGSVSQPEHGAD